ncbi:hypothetical protein ORI20_00940 [Mycobacterium sp. CVI_P3]|uniref:Polyketide cyclase n=1 Tax=Mycobacterium pinniadriaticum TaxID=2994102 RepID=A0ABT3S737_9MYCO|nr:hypothetical protein [Mycobacterium pinniadriaticum]MCX2928820.1 hypothetical protein [Mycobacterium pinniadriaticum]MCX2935313.1 hypothetical protein [Mycobacterium pinniadriaticum]
MDEKLDEHFRFEMSDDVDGVLATLAGDVEHDIVGTPGGPTSGRENVWVDLVAIIEQLPPD